MTEYPEYIIQEYMEAFECDKKTAIELLKETDKAFATGFENIDETFKPREERLVGEPEKKFLAKIFSLDYEITPQDAWMLEQICKMRGGWQIVERYRGNSIAVENIRKYRKKGFKQTIISLD